jgi:dTDP-4-amino-4,6-dideoxygalactose transaminase
MIPLFKVRMADEAKALVGTVLDSGYIGQGPKCEEFERQFGEYIGLYPLNYQPLLLNSCTSAIDLALHLIGVGPGDEVISTPITCTATNSPPALRGARITWADVDPLTGNIDPMDVARKATKRTRAIIAVNWGGRSCDYAALGGNDVPIIEDAAHGPYDARALDSDYVCYSFQAIKHLTTGDGGALVVPFDQHRRAKLLRWYGLDRESSADFRCAQNIQEIGYKYQSNDIAAAIGLANLTGMAAAVKRGQEHAEYYCKWLADLPGIDVPPYDPQCAYWLMTLCVDDRDAFIAHLGEKGIAASQVHASNTKHDAFKAVSEMRGALPGVKAFDQRQVSIPNGWWVTDEQRDYIAATIHEWAFRRARQAA